MSGRNQLWVQAEQERADIQGGLHGVNHAMER